MWQSKDLAVFFRRIYKQNYDNNNSISIRENTIIYTVIQIICQSWWCVTLNCIHWPHNRFVIWKQKCSTEQSNGSMEAFWKQNLFIALLMPAMHIVLGHFTQLLTFWIRMTISVLEQDLRLMLRCSSGGSAGYLPIGSLVVWSQSACQIILLSDGVWMYVNVR